MTRAMTVFVILLLGASARGEVESGPKAGAKVEELTVACLTGAQAGKEVELAADRKDLPTVYLVVNADKFSRPMARFLKELDGKLGEVKDAAAFAIWVGGDADKNKEYLPKVQGSMKFDKIAMAISPKPNPTGWGINDDAHLTVVVAHGGKVVKSHAFVTVNEKDVKGVMEELSNAAKK